MTFGVVIAAIVVFGLLVAGVQAAVSPKRRAELAATWRHSTAQTRREMAEGAAEARAKRESRRTTGR